MPTRIDKLVSERFKLSRRAAQDAVRNGKVDVGGNRCDEPGVLVDESADVTYHPNRPKARRIVRSGVEVLYEDDAAIIVNKPPGLLTLPTLNHETDTLSTRVERYLHLRHGRAPTLGVIHRLDKDTSGALAFAKHARALRAFQDLFQIHAIERQYLAVVEGTLASAAGTIDTPLVIGGDNARHRVAREAGEGVAAVTHYRVVERFGPVASLLAVWLETGRTHQIRLHMAHIGHPVVGDTRYRPPDRPLSKARFKRQALHAQTLGFVQPLSGVRVRVEAPLPHDLAAWIADLRLRYGIRGAGG
jgi:23S rRNA pseudouridine1911/1915/1917 synthase